MLVVLGADLIAADIATVTGVPVVAVMAPQRRLDEAVDLGLGPVRSGRGPLRRAAGEVLDAVLRTGGAVVSAALVEEVRERLARQPGELTPHRVAHALRESGQPVGDATVLAVHEALRRDVLGAGPTGTTAAAAGRHRRPGERSRARRSSIGAGGSSRRSVRFPDHDSVRRLAQRLAASGGRRLDDASPYVDVRLADGTRFHAVLAPVAAPGTLLSLRVPTTPGVHAGGARATPGA